MLIELVRIIIFRFTRVWTVVVRAGRVNANGNNWCHFMVRSHLWKWRQGLGIVRFSCQYLCISDKGDRRQRSSLSSLMWTGHATRSAAGWAWKSGNVHCYWRDRHVFQSGVLAPGEATRKVCATSNVVRGWSEKEALLRACQITRWKWPWGSNAPRRRM